MPTEVIIFDKSFKLECPANEEHNLHVAAKILESKYREARISMPRLEAERVAAMVAFNLVLEHAKLTHQFKVLSEERNKEKAQTEQLIEQLTQHLEDALTSS